MPENEYTHEYKEETRLAESRQARLAESRQARLAESRQARLAESRQAPDRKFLAISAVLSFLVLFGVTFAAYEYAARAPSARALSGSAAGALSEPSAFAHVAIGGKAAYVFDISRQVVLFEKNASAQLPLASLTKIMVALLATEYLSDDSLIAISKDALASEGDSGFVAGEQWRMADLLHFTLMTSSNDGAATLAEAVEKKAGRPVASVMNERAAGLGLYQTYFINGTGLDEDEELFSGAYGSAENMARLMSAAYRHAARAFESTALPYAEFHNAAGKAYEAQNTNGIVDAIPGLVMGKTGYTDLAGGNLAVVFEKEPGHAVVVVVLGSTREGRFNDVLELVEASIAETL